MELANSIIALQPGMYILRHPKTGLPPISVSRAAGSAGSTGRVEALYTPGTDGGVLRSGSDCIVMHVLNAPVELLVTAYLEKAGATVPTLRVDKIALEADAAGSNQPLAAKPITIPPKGISLIGHIERTGDVVATAGKTLGDPARDMRLEGFQVMWPDKPEGVELSYGVRLEGAGATPPVPTGKFCGTRNAATRIVDVNFTLTGPKAAHYALKGKAYFSGGYGMEISSAMPLSGPSGLEHLTALSLEVAPAPAGKAIKGPWDASPRTKIFKGGKSAAKSI
jgi:hypothetical protein